MKAILLLSVVLGTSFSVSAFACEGEAQVAARVAQTSFRLGNGCNITIKNVTSFAVNPFCPLSLDEINATGISTAVANGHECVLSPGDSIQAVVVKKNGSLFLE